MTFSYDLIGIGGLAVDVALRVAALPLAGEKYPARLTGKQPGGFIANATCAAARLGLETAYIGWCGDDADGDLLDADFQQWGVDPVGLVREPGATTPFTLVVSDEAGERCILLPDSPLYHRPLSAAHHDQIAAARVALSFPRDAAWCDQIAAAARRGGGIVALDVETAVPLGGAALREAVNTAEIVFVSEASLARMGAASLHDLVDGARWVVMTAGARGAFGLTAGIDQPVFCPARQVPVVDTTGAGDCFHAALLAAWLDGADLHAALRFATAAASFAVQQPGARGGLPDRAAVERAVGA